MRLEMNLASVSSNIQAHCRKSGFEVMTNMRRKQNQNQVDLETHNITHHQNQVDAHSAPPTNSLNPLNPLNPPPDRSLQIAFDSHFSFCAIDQKTQNQQRKPLEFGATSSCSSSSCSNPTPVRFAFFSPLRVQTSSGSSRLYPLIYRGSPPPNGFSISTSIINLHNHSSTPHKMNSSIASASMAETYFLASKARHKLTKEASRPDLHLRQLVSHANLVDLLMDELAERRAKGKVNHSAPQNKNIVSSDELTQAINMSSSTPSHIMEEDESDNEYEQVSTPNYTYQAYESIEEVDDDEDDEDEEVETDSESASTTTCFYNTTNSSVDDLQAPQLYYSSSSDEEDDLEHHNTVAESDSQTLHKSGPFQVSELPLASESPIIVA